MQGKRSLKYLGHVFLLPSCRWPTYQCHNSDLTTNGRKASFNPHAQSLLATRPFWVYRTSHHTPSGVNIACKALDIDEASPKFDGLPTSRLPLHRLMLAINDHLPCTCRSHRGGGYLVPTYHAGRSGLVRFCGTPHAGRRIVHELVLSAFLFRILMSITLCV